MNDPTLTEQLHTKLLHTQQALTTFYDAWVQTLDPYNVPDLSVWMITEHVVAVKEARKVVKGTDD